MKFALGIEYEGTHFHGWQRQQSLPTVQGLLESALGKIANEPIEVYCAGRTDTGVHGLGQVVHFITHVARPLRAWTWGTNTHLPSSIVVRWAVPVDESFHARFSAIARRYRYIIYNAPIRSALLQQRVTHIPIPLNVKKMQAGALHLLGELDFSAFRSASCESSTPMRAVKEIAIQRFGDYIITEIEANAFLHHMVRNIMGVLIQVGQERQPPDWVKNILLGKDRRLAAETASPSGLYLLKVLYPEAYVFPSDHAMFFPIVQSG